MAVDEAARHEVFEWLREAAGPERAATLMSMLPAVDWNDVATKRDLEEMERRLRADLLADFRGELLAHTRTMVFGMVAMAFTVASLTIAAVRLG
jgi:hypothetical protein